MATPASGYRVVKCLHAPEAVLVVIARNTGTWNATCKNCFTTWASGQTPPASVLGAIRESAKLIGLSADEYAALKLPDTEPSAQ